MPSWLIGWGAAAAVVLAAWAHGWTTGAGHEQGKAQALAQAALLEAYKQGQAVGKVRDKIITEYVDRVQVIEKRGATIVKEVKVYVSDKSNAACTVPVGFVRVHDASANNLPAPEPAGPPDETAAGIELSTVAETVSANYTDCLANAEQLRQLQAFITQQGGHHGSQDPAKHETPQ